MANAVVKFGSTLASAFDLSEYIEDHDDGSNKRLNMQALPKRHGGLVTEVPVVEPRRIRLSGRISADTKEDLRTIIRNIASALGYSRKKLYLFDDRYYNAYNSSFQFKYLPGTGMLSAVIQLEFIADDPFEYPEGGNTIVTQTILASDTVVDPTNGYYKKSFLINNPGSVFIYPKHTITANQGVPVGRVIIRNQTTSRNQQYTGTIAIGNALVIQNGNFKVENNGVNDLTNFVGSFLHLDPGDNTIEIEGSLAQYQFEFAARYL